MNEFKNKNFFQSLNCAIKGLIEILKEERNFKIYLFIFLIFLSINIVFKIPIYEMCVFLISTLIVLTLEVINTAFERMVDKLMPSKNNNAKIIKDYLAGSVLISGIFFFVIEFIILISNKWGVKWKVL